MPDSIEPVFVEVTVNGGTYQREIVPLARSTDAVNAFNGALVPDMTSEGIA